MAYIGAICNSLQKEQFPECSKSNISWQDRIMSGFGCLRIKVPISLLQFDKDKEDKVICKNLRIYIM